MKYVKSTEMVEHGELTTAIVHLTERMEVLSSAILNGGSRTTETLFIMQVPHHFHCDDPWELIRKHRDSLGLPEDSVGMMTAAEVKYVFTVTESDYGGMSTFAAVTAGLSNQVVAGEVLDNWEERFKISMERYKALLAGTINIIGVSSVPLTEEAKINIMMPMIEAKTAALNTLGYSETGTTSDSIAIVSPIGENREQFAGTGMPLGISMARSVKAGVISNLVKRGDYPVVGTFMDKLAKIGITCDKMWEASMEIYYPNPDWDERMLRRRFEEKLTVLCEDINISSLVQAAICLEDLGNKDCICSMPRGMFKTDPIHLISDEIIGMQIAQYIAGTKGIFEFHRFDRHKPGIIGGLGPFMDDMLCGLIGGVMSSIYTDLFDSEAMTRHVQNK
jgi:adenosylcobinamide hydrolase